MPRRRGLADSVEWGLGLLSALIVVAMIGYFISQPVVEPRALPDLTVEVLPSSAQTKAVRFAVKNRGGRSATDVVVSLTLRDGGRVVDERTLTIEYIPANSVVMGGFSLPPGAVSFTPELAVDGYLDP